MQTAASCEHVRLRSAAAFHASVLIMALIVGTIIPIPTIAADIIGRVIAVTDGDTVTIVLFDGRMKVRLAEIDTPEQDQPWGMEAKRALSDKVYWKSVRIRTEGFDQNGRMLGRIFLRDRDINREMVREGNAWVYRKYMSDDSLLKDEDYARFKGVGLWSLPEPERIPPWEWRRGGRAVQVAEEDQARSGFVCSGKKYCKEMINCAEALFYLRECGVMHLDSDNDGVPCEAICR